MTNKFERLANWNPPVNRRDPLAVLREQEDGRIPWLLPIRHGRMAANLFAHVRGSAATMEADLIWPANQVRGIGPALRGCPPPQLWLLRLPGAIPALRHCRLQRNLSKTL